MQSIPPIQRILIVEPSDTESARLADLLDGLGIPSRTVKTASQALYSLRSFPVDIIFCDQDVPGLDRLDFLPQLHRAAPGVPLILTTAETVAENESQATAQGAWEVLQKPVQPGGLECVLRRAGVARNLQRHVEELNSQLIERCAPPPLAASSPSMIALLESLEEAASSHRPTLLEGEPGTNKESIARALHELSGHRAGPFIALRCQRGRSGPGQTGGPDDHKLTFPSMRGNPSVLAAGGTLFLAAIEKLSLSAQAEVFRLVQDEDGPRPETRHNSAPMQIVISTHTDIEESVRAGTFLKELHEVMSRNRLQVPALRNRREDIPLLADHWCRAFASQLGRNLLGINDQAMSQLISHSWPGNLRELEAVLRLAVSRAESDRITAADLPLNLFDAMTEDPARRLGLKEVRHRAEAEAIRRALSATHGNRTHAARLLQISHRALLYKLKAYEIRD